MTTTTERDAAPWIGGTSAGAADWLELTDPYSGTLVTRVARTDAATVAAAVAAAHQAQPVVAGTAAHARAAVLRRAADLPADTTGMVPDAHAAQRSAQRAGQHIPGQARPGRGRS